MATSPVGVTANAFELLSLNLLSCKVSSEVDVPVIAAMFVPALCVLLNGVVGGVKLPV